MLINPSIKYQKTKLKIVHAFSTAIPSVIPECCCKESYLPKGNYTEGKKFLHLCFQNWHKGKVAIERNTVKEIIYIEYYIICNK